MQSLRLLCVLWKQSLYLIYPSQWRFKVHFPMPARKLKAKVTKFIEKRQVCPTPAHVLSTLPSFSMQVSLSSSTDSTSCTLTRVALLLFSQGWVKLSFWNSPVPQIKLFKSKSHWTSREVDRFSVISGKFRQNCFNEQMCFIDQRWKA